MNLERNWKKSGEILEFPEMIGKDLIELNNRKVIDVLRHRRTNFKDMSSVEGIGYR